MPVPVQRLATWRKKHSRVQRFHSAGARSRRGNRSMSPNELSDASNALLYRDHSAVMPDRPIQRKSFRHHHERICRRPCHFVRKRLPSHVGGAKREKMESGWEDTRLQSDSRHGSWDFRWWTNRIA
ncbi:unnamed protein product [Nesidiocoris tenuis]|uniref:Uncharacterized protein n=1 Tax=Nesidiocoris tenuis TaxID=355587 RepID=A0A6H5H4S7_9HEMI|nr:unnamed protein product [Nesidiocoris tenuis]